MKYQPNESKPQLSLELRRSVSDIHIFEMPMKTPGAFLRSASEVYEHAKKISTADREMFYVYYLNTKNAVIESAIHTIGGRESSAVYPAEVCKSALILGATALIFVHNHPSGDPDPSLCDRDITRQLCAACHLFQIRVLDHLIIGRDCFYSFADHGLIEEFNLAASSAGF